MRARHVRTNFGKSAAPVPTQEQHEDVVEPLLKSLLTAACVASHRSFAIVIQQLPERLRDPVCVFYLVLRALDTVEDDMAISQDVKIPLLRAFHDKCYDKCAPATRAQVWRHGCAFTCSSERVQHSGAAFIWECQHAMLGSCCGQLRISQRTERL